MKNSMRRYRDFVAVTMGDASCLILVFFLNDDDKIALVFEVYVKIVKTKNHESVSHTDLLRPKSKKNLYYHNIQLYKSIESCRALEKQQLNQSVTCEYFYIQQPELGVM